MQRALNMNKSNQKEIQIKMKKKKINKNNEKQKRKIIIREYVIYIESMHINSCRLIIYKYIDQYLKQEQIKFTKIMEMEMK